MFNVYFWWSKFDVIFKIQLEFGVKKLSLAIYWHIHQPSYKIEGAYLMPWARLHAVKDYLDMVLFLDKFPKLKLNVDIVPALLDTIIDYTNGYNDIHSELSVANVSAMTDEEKSFILNNFFTLKVETMLYRSENYKALYKKRFAQNVCNPADFDERELSDLIALFNLVWIDSVHYERYPRLKELWAKQYNYTQEERAEIIDIHYSIIKEIIPTYKRFLQDGRIEITPSPYYHPILPVMLDMKSAVKSALTQENFPKSLKLKQDALIQIKLAQTRIKEVFGIEPKGLWMPELCVDSKTLDLLSSAGAKWTIADERTLSDSINFQFVRDFHGNLNEPYHLLKVYEYKGKNSNIDVVFRDRSIPTLINFEYCGIDTGMAVYDLMDKIKTIQNKLLTSPDETHLLTICMDGENCWESYQNDGNDFLTSFYSELEKDETLETVLLSDYIEKDKHKKQLNKVVSGSWIDKTFQYWIGETTKNKAWSMLENANECYLKSVKFADSEILEKAHQELLVAQGSDWFWWYGEPNNSGQDFIFDYMFREHLKNVYKLLDCKIPQELNESLITRVDLPLKYPTDNISPRADGLISSSDDWYCSGNINLLDGPVYRENKNVDKIQFGCDSNNIYFRLYINKNSSDDGGFIEKINQFFIYMRNKTEVHARAHIRLIAKTENQYPIFEEKFEKELALTFYKENMYPPRLSACLRENIWTLANPEGIKVIKRDVVDLTVPFDVLGVKHGESVELFMANTDSGVKNNYIPQEIMLTLTRK